MCPKYTFQCLQCLKVKWKCNSNTVHCNSGHLNGRTNPAISAILQMCALSKCICVNIDIFVFLLHNTFTVTQLTRDKLGVHQSGMWFQYENRLQVLARGWIAAF